MKREIQLPSGEITLVDDGDFSLASQYRWRLSTGGYAIGKTSSRNGERSRTIYLHRLIMKPPEGFEVDHINRDRLDNRRQNLRVVTRHQNAIWRQGLPNSTSRFKGVGFHKSRNTWRAYIKVNGKSMNLGYFKYEEDAAYAYDAAARRLFGDSAYTNFGEMTPCNREHRIATVACYVVYDDGTVYVVYAPCCHGISEVSALYHPRLRFEDDDADAVTPAVEMRA